MVTHTQTIRRQQSTDCLSVFVYFVGLTLKGLRKPAANKNKPKTNLVAKMSYLGIFKQKFEKTIVIF